MRIVNYYSPYYFPLYTTKVSDETPSLSFISHFCFLTSLARRSILARLLLNVNSLTHFLWLTPAIIG